MINTASGKNMYSFLSVGWGLLSDIDIESERLWFLGESRFAAWTLVRTFNLKSYRGRLSFKLVQSAVPSPAAATVTQSHSRGTDIDRLYDQEWKQRDSYASAETLPCHVPAPVHLKPLSEPVPDDWVVIDGEFLFMYAVNCAYIGTDVLFAPNLSTDDGRIALVFIRKGVSRVDIVSLPIFSYIYSVHCTVAVGTKLRLRNVAISRCVSSSAWKKVATSKFRGPSTTRCRLLDWNQKYLLLQRSQDT